MGLKIATIAAAQQEAGGVSAAGGHMKDAATGLSTITSYKGVKADGIYADGKALKISATATGMEGVYQFVIDQVLFIKFSLLHWIALSCCCYKVFFFFREGRGISFREYVP